MITKTSLKHPTVKRSIRGAMKRVICDKWAVCHVRNKQGQAYLAVRYNRDTKEVIIYGRDNQIITDTVRASYE